MRRAASLREGEGREGEGEPIPPHGSQAGSWKQSAQQRGEAEEEEEWLRVGQGGHSPIPCPAHTHRRGTVTGVGVVLDFPQALVEAFSLVWFPVFVFVLFIREQIFRAQEGAGRRQSRGEAGAGGRQSPEEGARRSLRLVGAEEEDGVLVRGGFHGAVSDVVDLKGNPKQQEVRDSC